MRNLLAIVLLFMFNLAHGQPLGKERVERLKKAVVQILIDGKSSGTGFVIMSDDKRILVLTCWHVIEKSLSFGENGNPIESGGITAEFISGERIRLRIIGGLLEEDYKKALSFDYCMLVLAAKPKQEISNIKIGKFADINEGDQVYTCGYPLGIQQQFISTGMLSTKYIDSTKQLNFPNGNHEKIYRDVALLDLTMNRGNSGGPIIKIGGKIEDDEVIGIADFMVSSGVALQPISEILNKTKDIAIPTYDSTINVQLIGVLKEMTNAALNNANGVSGCISIDHFMKLISP